MGTFGHSPFRPSRRSPSQEITQIKGTSETHPDLSPTDEFAGFEQWDYTLSADFERPKHRKGSFARQACWMV
jgi:Protein of unknown function (DUF3604)